MSIFKGAGVAIATPFKEDGSVNYEEFAKLIEFQIANGTDAIIVCGTTGESATMTMEEHSEVIRFCVKQVNGRIPVVAGTGSNDTKAAIQLSRDAEKDGADAVLLVTPYYNKATQNGLVAHYKAICGEIKIPAILYNVPSRTGVNIQPETVARIAREVPNVKAIKDATGNISQTATMMQLTDGNIDLYSGNDDQIVPILSLGGLGVISVLSNVAPRETHEICEKFFEGDVKGSCALQLKALPLIHALFSEVNPIPVKTALKYIGINAGPVHLPLTEMEPQHAEILKKAMIDFGLKVQ